MKRFSGPVFALPFGPELVVRHALAAYERAVGEATPPIDYPEPEGWSNAGTFVEMLTDYFQLSLASDAVGRGFSVPTDLARFAKWHATPVHRDLHVREVDPGLWAMMLTADPSRAGAGL